MMGGDVTGRVCCIKMGQGRAFPRKILVVRIFKKRKERSHAVSPKSIGIRSRDSLGAIIRLRCLDPGL
jgi:hypothetical protein